MVSARWAEDADYLRHSQRQSENHYRSQVAEEEDDEEEEEEEKGMK